MPAEKPHANREQVNTIRGILMLSAWGFAMVLSSFLFLYIGYLVDEILGTTPNFMLCSFLLAIGLCMWTLYIRRRKKKGRSCNGGLLKNVHLLRCAANRTAQRISNTLRYSVFARLASEHF